MSAEVFSRLLEAWSEPDPALKCKRVAQLAFPQDDFAVPAIDGLSLAPGRPAQPRLIDPRDVPNRGLGTPEGRAALIHAVAHIEFNAINLALDAALRFRQMPCAYYRDWLSVAQDEARHFQMLRARLIELGCEYGAFAAHNGLWEAAEKTADDVLARMALVPRVLEARGLDVTPGIIRRLRGLNDLATADILAVILEEEVRHVAIGTHWYRWLCDQRGVDQVSTFNALLAHAHVVLRQPVNREARLRAGFTEAELL